MKKGKYGVIILEEDEEKWLRKHFPNTKNDDIQERFSKKWGRPMTFSLLHRLARKYGLKKSPQFVRKMNKAATDKAAAVNSRNGYAIQRAHMQRLHETGLTNKFKKGESNLDRMGPEKYAEMQRKNGEKRRALMKREKTRRALGLPQQTDLYLPDPMSHRQVCYRHNMLKKGYIVIYKDEELRLNIYYDENTVRRPIAERNAPKYGMRILALPPDL